jgi:hypothetical protein
MTTAEMVRLTRPIGLNGTLRHCQGYSDPASELASRVETGAAAVFEDLTGSKKSAVPGSIKLVGVVSRAPVLVDIARFDMRGCQHLRREAGSGLDHGQQEYGSSEVIDCRCRLERCKGEYCSDRRRGHETNPKSADDPSVPIHGVDFLMCSVMDGP